MRWIAAPWLLGFAAALASACRADDLTPRPPPPSSSTASGAGGAGQGGAPPDAGLGGGGAGGAGSASGGVSVLSWNIETFPIQQDTASRVAQIVSDLDPDVIAVEEIENPDAFLALPNALPTYTAVLNDDPGAFLRVGILYKTSRIALSEIETLFTNDSYKFPRPPLKARVTALDAQAPGLDFVLLVLHLKAQLDAESEQRRRLACQALDMWVRAQMAAGPELDFVLAGDWNDELTDPTQDNVFQVFLDDPSTYSFLTMPAAQAGEFSYIPFESMLDHILITTDALGEYGAGTTEVLHLDASYPQYETNVSDHRPVLSQFAGPAAP